MKKLLEPFNFSFGQLQDIVTMLNHLKKNGISAEKFVKFVEKKKAEIVTITDLDQDLLRMKKDMTEWKKAALKCSKCNTPMNLFPVNTNKQNQTGDKSKSQWFCPKCWYEIYSEKTTADWIKELNKQGSKNG